MEAYLDNSATTPLCKSARDEMVNAIENIWGNPSSLHEKGIEADLLLKNARKTLAALLSCTEKEIIFTSGGTEGNNLAVFGAAHAGRRRGNRIITSAVEHPSVSKAFDRLEGEGFEVIRIPTDKKGLVDLTALENAVNEKTVLISIMAVNNEVGTVEPFEELSKIAKCKGSPALIHVDAVQAFGKIPLTPKKWGIDLMTVSSHKIHGPKGVGAVFVKEGTRLSPVAAGGGQERDIRPGTEPMPAIAGFTGAMKELKIKNSLAGLTELRDYLVSELEKRDFVTINSPENALPYIVNLSLKGLRSETVLNLLSDMEIYISSGSACSKGHKSPVLTAMGLDDSIIDSSLRVSMSRFTTRQQLDYFLQGIDTAQKVIRKK
ncbi:MAG: cysteine desulfurase [Ruminococcaceae bacterium]|nr:cysteine desulfurase [Oscillospiraceae bacterium]